MPVRRTIAGFAVALALAAPLGPAHAADLPETIVMNTPIARDEPCADVHVLGKIQERFDWAETRTWRRGLFMNALVNPRSSNHPYDEPGLIRREYCVADSAMSDGTTRSTYYAIEFGQGFASIGNYVDFCVLGLDPWHVHDEGCRKVR